MKNKILLLIMMLVMAWQGAEAQTVVNYDSPKDYIIEGITVSGIKYLNKQAIIQISGLKVGQKVAIPGDQITRSVEKLWRQGLFSDVSIGITSTTPDGKVFLDIKLEERPKLNKVTYKGIRKGEKEDLENKVNLIPGTKITDHTLTKTRNIIMQHYYEKGYYNVDVRTVEVPDTNLQNVSNLIINVDKGKKVKILNITPIGDSVFT
ncbi:MAG: hypothetical protein IIT37_14040, partial [Bacteroidales bacterium]|nr:hypothetical protein [Bacteroidales bacterium]